MSDTKKLSEWMISKGFATGHGDTLDDLLDELIWQLEELIKKPSIFHPLAVAVRELLNRVEYDFAITKKPMVDDLALSNLSREFVNLPYAASIAKALAHNPAPVSGWKTMESASKESMILVTNGRGTWPARWMGGRDGDGYYELDSPYTRINNCTFWLPIPPPPASSEKGETV